MTEVAKEAAKYSYNWGMENLEDWGDESDDEDDGNTIAGYNNTMRSEILNLNNKNMPRSC